MRGAHNPDARKRLIAAVHAEAKRAGLDDDLRREVYFQATGKRSAAEMTNNQLGKVLDAIKGRAGARAKAARGRTLADSAHAKKIRALWLSLWNLGAVADPTETGIAAFAARQCGVQALQWVSPGEATRIIEALRAIGRRYGWHVKPGCTVEEAELALVAAQFEILIGMHSPVVAAAVDAIILSPVELACREVIRRYGEIIRRHQGGGHA